MLRRAGQGAGGEHAPRPGVQGDHPVAQEAGDDRSRWLRSRGVRGRRLRAPHVPHAEVGHGVVRPTPERHPGELLPGGAHRVRPGLARGQVEQGEPAAALGGPRARGGAGGSGRPAAGGVRGCVVGHGGVAPAAGGQRRLAQRRAEGHRLRPPAAPSRTTWVSPPGRSRA